MKIRCLTLSVVLVFLILPLPSPSFSEEAVSFSSKTLVRGGLLLITVTTDGQEQPQVEWMRKRIALVYNKLNAKWYGFIAADLNQKRGIYKVLVRLPSSGFKKKFYIKVRDKNYGMRKLKLPKEKVELNAESLRRVRKEAAMIHSLWTMDSPLPLWRGEFLLPVEGDIIGAFGKKSIINKMKRAPHSGVDIRASKGEPVIAINNGSVVLVADHFFTGKSIYLDHGGGIISMYFHLDKIMVNDEESVEKGQIIGQTGESGRATGPHLHWGVRINGARVNPLTLIELSKRWDD